ncbi:hypothetical protein, partial [Sphingobacterium multivorum]|uniref:hypothetical protein n=7 Tax=Sphingobacterium TaxID=28453 RepID=UPI0028A62A1B
FFYTEALAGNSQGLLSFSYLPVLPRTMLLHILRTSLYNAIAYLPYFPDWRCPRASTVPIQATSYCSFPKRLWLAGYSWIV